MRPPGSFNKTNPIVLLYQRLNQNEQRQVRRWMETLVAKKIHRQRSPTITEKICTLFVQNGNRDLSIQDIYLKLDTSVSTKQIIQTLSRRDDLFEHIIQGVYCLKHTTFFTLKKQQEEKPWGTFDA